MRLWEPGKRVQVDITAGKDHAKFGRSAIGARGQIQGFHNAGFEQRGEGHGTGGFDDDFHAFPDQARGGNDLFLGDQENAVHMAAQNGEGARRERSPQAVGDGVAGFEGLERSRSERAVGVVGVGGLAADDSNVLANALCAEAGSAE